MLISLLPGLLFLGAYAITIICHLDKEAFVGELDFLLSCDMLLGERAIGSAGGLCRRGYEVPSVTRRRSEDTWCRALSRCGKQHRVGYDN